MAVTKWLSIACSARKDLWLIKANQKEIRNLESGYSGGLKKAVLAGFWSTLIFMAILAVVSQGVLIGQGELSIILSEFFIFWAVFSIAIKFIFY